MKWNIRFLLLLLSGGVGIIILLQALHGGYLSQTEGGVSFMTRQLFDRSLENTDTEGGSFGVQIFPDGREVSHIAFLKVHKAASGTTTSLIFRYGVSRGLTFVLPKYINSISSSATVHQNAIYPRLNKSFDIMTSHVIYNRTAFERFLPNDTVYIGILREPYEQFKSSMNYMQPKYVYNISETSPIQLYLSNPMKYEPPNPKLSWINNRQSVEFGADVNVIRQKRQSDISQFVKQIDKDFHLVMIAEYFDESVVLMRRMLNWKFQDILYRRLHIRGWDKKITLPRQHDRHLYRKWAAVDYAMYEFFFQKLWRQVRMAGADFHDEVLYFKQIRQEVEDFCKLTPNITGIYSIPYSKWNQYIEIDAKFCKMLFAEEEDWVKIIGFNQYNIKPK